MTAVTAGPLLKAAFVARKLSAEGAEMTRSPVVRDSSTCSYSTEKLWFPETSPSVLLPKLDWS
jgi:hypothetical protein